MRGKTKFLGAPVLVAELKSGDIALAETTTGKVQVHFVITDTDDTSALMHVILSTPAVGGGSFLPVALKPTELTGYVFRKLDDDELSVQPLSLEAEDIFSSHFASGTHVKDGSILLDSSGELVIRMDTQDRVRFCQLSTGVAVKIDLRTRQNWLQEWRLVWKDGDDEVTLLTVGNAS
mgnify:FL=1